ncbi:cofactor-independent phosphoglycerate mutase [Clostridium aminobutyricum]|uniref:Cofactor-independent phosphoglycerate mutase n=1 Tax=Clostridium aminobutyricum TaxID=33953 RepID=A0A939D9Z2_CLOAM|nr:cofactor-independent phosphoglycerate mutase [Clostridium aminobutyricum]MBN7773782.1 cofactor-independent phosphoglycerate mutase [Clostridium aminobutyricum]
MKYLIIVPDGAGDDKIEALGGKTPLEVANMPFIKSLAERGEVGMVQTIPEGVAPGSDAANLSVMGYDPSIYLTGRSPLEAASIGIDMSDTDVAFRTNIITVTGDGEYEDLIITDHSSGDITTEEADILIKAVNEKFGSDIIQFYTGVSYRHCMIVKNGSTDYQLTPPHDVLTQRVGDHLPKGEGAEFITKMMKESYEFLKEHPVNKARVERGLNPANTIWIWGQGKKPSLSSFYDKYKITGTAISAVDLIKGIAICAGLNSVDVEGATGTLHTNFAGKAQAAIEEFKKGKDFLYVHLEGPDECAHQGDQPGKIQCLESIDEKIAKPIVGYLREAGEPFRVLIVPDHRTPLAIRTHSSTPVPYVLYDSTNEQPADLEKAFHEDSGEKGNSFGSGYELADYFFEKK